VAIARTRPATVPAVHPGFSFAVYGHADAAIPRRPARHRRSGATLKGGSRTVQFYGGDRSVFCYNGKEGRNEVSDVRRADADLNEGGALEDGTSTA
jgi:hypothetical protein